MALVENYPGMSELDELSVQTIRFLSAEGVQKASSGHPGMPLGMATVAYTLWMRHLRYSPANPRWHNRDRFVLSAGHGSMLLYSLLHLTGFDISLDDLKNFRQMGSKTPGHPEYEPQYGIEVTTGPLGQGLSNAVGMAIAEKYLAQRYNRDGFELFSYNVYTIAGDGCLEEGIGAEVSSLAGHLGLDNLIMIYDDNHITIDGDTQLAFTEDVVKRYEAYGWNVLEVGDANDMESFEKAVEQAKAQSERPTMIKVRSHIGYGSPNKQDTADAHGAPLGDDEIRLMKQKFGWDPDKSFEVPEKVLDNMRQAGKKGRQTEQQWNKLFAEYRKAHPELAEEITTAEKGKLGVNLDELMPKFKAGDSIATRKASGKVLDTIMPKLPLVVGGSADLTPSNKTRFADARDFQKDNRSGRYIRYGVREHAMGAVINGIAVSDLVRPYGGTFLVFSDYMRGAVRVAAMSGYPSIFVFTHDSIGLGEDGPTHQPVEHIPSLRTLPGLKVIRPADANETAQAWKYVLENPDGPAALLLSRQGLEVLDQDKYGSAKGLAKGAYVLKAAENPDVLLMASGSEVSIALEAGEKLEEQGVKAQIVSMPCWELFEAQTQQYKDSVLPPDVDARVGIEAAISLGWDRWLGCYGRFVGVTEFGVSAPYKAVFSEFGITPDNVAKQAKESIADAKKTK